MVMELSDLTNRRRKHIQSCRDNNDNSHEIIAGLYSDPSHFIYELLQNADDAGASEILFFLTSKALLITHNGKKLFDFDDVDSITTVGSSTKKNDVNSIGTFGAGFKSVFAITTTPRIHSGDYHFQIIDFIVPEEIESINIEKQYTHIILPFNHPDILSEIARKQIADRLQVLESESLLFLRNIKEIQWRTESDNGHYLSEINGNKASLISKVNNEDSLREYFLSRKYIDVDDTKLNIVVAYQLNSDRKIVPVHDSKLFVFFPTNERTGFKFLVHAPYKTNPSRESIPFSDNQNRAITTALSTLVAESVIGLKDSGLLSVDALSILPIESNNEHPLYRSTFHQVKSMFVSNPLLPNIDGGYECAGNTMLARERELTKLLGKTDCLKLFDSEAWLSTDITYDKTRVLRDYLIGELGIPEITMQKFCSEITEEFVKTKSDDWVVRFYSSITKNKALYRVGLGYERKGILRERPIIRLEDGSHVCPENDSEDIQVYLPTRGDSKFKTVKRTLLDYDESKEFLTSLGLVVPDKIAEIKEFIIPKYQSGVIEKEEYIEDVKLVIEIWLDSNQYQKTEISDLLKACWFVRCKNQIGDISFQKLEVTCVYFNSSILSKWFYGGADKAIYFINIGIDMNNEYKEFFKSLGVDETLKIIPEEDPVSKSDSRYIQRIDGFNPNIAINGLKYALENISKRNSIFLWQFLLTHNPSRLSGRTKRKRYLKDEFIVGEIENSKILELLRDSAWLFDKESLLIDKPLSEILLSDLNNDYNKNQDNTEKLVKVLGLKLDKVLVFEEETGLKAVNKEEFEEFAKWKEAQALHSDDNVDGSEWKPDVSPDDATSIEDDAYLIEEKIEDLSGQNVGQASTDSEQENEDHKENSNNNESISPRNSKKIGDWGENIARKYLVKKYPDNDVVWLNRKGCVGKGYDFVIRDKEEDIVYYEVKSKTDEFPKLFQISGTQWNWATQLYKSNNGDMYKILLISNVGTKQPRTREISNPISLWKSGKLYADPVSIKL